MIEILLIWLSFLLVTLCLLAFHILRTLKSMRLHVHIQNHHHIHTAPIEDDDDDDPSEAWKNN